MPCNCPAIRNYTALVQGLVTAAITHIANAVKEETINELNSAVIAPPYKVCR